MNINVSEIIEKKLAQLDADGIIERKVEECLEKSIMSAITSELEGYSFRRGIEEQLKSAVSNIAADCGLSAYNGFIAKRCKQIVQELLNEDISKRLEKALNDIMLTKHENVKLSDIFKYYRKWVLENTDEDEKYNREKFTHSLEVVEDGSWTRYICKFADHELGSGYGAEKAEIEISFYLFLEKPSAKEITSLYLDGRRIGDSFKVGRLSDFEAFVLNLYYNETKIILDVDDVEEDPYFDIDI